MTIAISRGNNGDIVRIKAGSNLRYNSQNDRIDVWKLDMRLRYITVFDPSRSTNENDTFKQLLLFHCFGSTHSVPSLNEKLSIIGIIQGIWSFTSSCSNGDDGHKDLEKTIELNNDVILCIKVESRFFISLAISNISDEQNAIPFQYFNAYLWLSYKFFKLLNGCLLYTSRCV